MSRATRVRKPILPDDEEETLSEPTKTVKEHILDYSKLDKEKKWNYVNLVKHKLEESIDLSSLEPYNVKTKSKWGNSTTTKKVYSIDRLSRDPMMEELNQLLGDVGEELAEVLPGYEYQIYSKGVDIWAKDLSFVSTVSLNLSINHETRVVYTNLIFQ